MQEAQNTRVVQDAYTAFERGDIPGILAALDDNVVWRPVMGAGAHVPTAGERRGKIAVGEFFKILGDTVAFERFEPAEFIAQGDKVVVLGHYAAKTPAGRRFVSDWAMVFALRNGKVVSFQEFTDSAAIDRAYL
jgi:ketosteroid isomerase-like protein